MKYGYARVSTISQSLEIQEERLIAAGCDEIFMEKESGSKDNRKELNKILEKIKTGDTLYVVRIDRLGRRALKLMELINDFQKMGIHFVSLDNNIDTTTPMGRLTFNILASVSEMERELIRERVLAGMEKARKRGKTGGKPLVLTPDIISKAKALRDIVSVKDAYKMLSISRASYYKALNL